MPRAASRINLEILDIRVEGMQMISEEDAITEGALWHDGRAVGNSGWRHDINHGIVYPTAKDSFFALWNQINGPESFAQNPWVWVVEFNPITASSDR